MLPTLHHRETLRQLLHRAQPHVSATTWLRVLSQADAAVIASTRALICQVRAQTNLAYADNDWSPVSDITLGIIAKEMGAALVERPLTAGVQELGIPALFGPPLIAINRDAEPRMKRLALRHGLAHLVAGELEAEPDAQLRFMSSVFDWMTLEERRADLFALADIFPDRVLQELRAAGYSAAEVARHLYADVAGFWASGWPPERIRDRVTLRLALGATA